MKHFLNQIKQDYCDLYFTKKPKKVAVDIEPSLLDYLHYQSFNPHYNVFENQTTMGFVLKCSHFTGINERAKSSLRNLIATDIPSNCTVQVINYASPRVGNLLDDWYRSGNVSSIYKIITEKRWEFFKNGSWQSILGNRHNLLVRDFELYFCFSIPKAATLSGKQGNLYQLKELQDKITEGLNGIESSSYILGDKEFASFLQEILVPSFDLYKHKPDQKCPDIKDYFKSEQKLEMNQDGICFDNFHYLTFEVTEFPEYWDLESSINYVGQFDTGISLPSPFYISYGFSLKTREESERIADKYRMIKTQQGNSRLPMFFPKMFDEINDWRYVSERISQGERLGKAVMYVVICAKDREQAAKSESVLRDHFAKLKFRIEKVTYDTLNSFLYTLPFNLAENWPIIDHLRISSRMLSGSSMNLMPVFADMQNYSNPLMLFVGRRGQIFFFDNFKTADGTNGNFNMVIVGNSGRGKSVWLQEYTTAILRNGGQVIIIDDGRSFQNTCQLLGGDFVDFGGGDFCINPFSLYQSSRTLEKSDQFKEGFEEPFIELIVSILSIIISLDKNNIVDLNIGLHRTILANAVQAVIGKKGNLGGFTDIRDELEYNPSVRGKGNDKLLEGIVYTLNNYSEDGRYAKYFNGPSTLTINNDLTVFELSDLQHNLSLQNAVLMTVVFLVYAKIQGRDRRTTLIIDEFWRLGAHSALKSPIEGFARRGRKYNLSLVLASQCMSDFSKENSQAGAAALAQSDWRIMLSVDGKDEQMLKTELKMTSPEIEVANSLSGLKGSYSEFMIRHKNGNWQIGRLLLDPFSAKLYSTKAEDVAALKKMRDEGLDVNEAIERLLV